MSKINWHNIKSHNGSQAAAFEELCAQIARVENPIGFRRKGAPDAGVECYAVSADGTEIAWQAKYFFELGDSQWSQLDSSVKTALDKHPNLTQYFICVPYDRPDVRKSGRKSAMDKWDEHVAKWQEWALERKMNVEFIYLGNSELADLLTQPKHSGRLIYWFGERTLSQDWFENHLKISFADAGPRYTPDKHVALDVTKKFDIIALNEGFLNELHSRADTFLSSFRYFSSPPDDAPLKEIEDNIRQELETINRLIRPFEISPDWDLPWKEVCSALDSILNLLDSARSRLQSILEAKGDVLEEEHREGHSRFLRLVQELRYDVNSMLASVKSWQSATEASLTICTGSAGSGKTHLVCDLAQERSENGHPTVLVMAHQLMSLDSPWSQSLNQLGFPTLSSDEFLGALESAAQASNSKALFIIDAINEGKGDSLWSHHISAFAEYFKKYPWIELVITVRDSYLDHIIPETLREQSHMVYHRGFGESTYDAIVSYFTHYDIELPTSPILDPEFSNPLFLKEVCKGLNKLGIRQLPRGHMGISDLFELRLRAANNAGWRPLDTSPDTDIVSNGLSALARRMSEVRSNSLPRSQAETLINELLPGRRYSESLYAFLLAEGLIFHNMAWVGNGQYVDSTYIAYERFSDHEISKYLLASCESLDDLSGSLDKTGSLHFLSEANSRPSAGIIEALMIQIPEKFGAELVDLIPNIGTEWYFTQTFLSSVQWRTSDSISARTIALLSDIGQHRDSKADVVRLLILLAPIPTHKLNAHYSTKVLAALPMPERDSSWGIAFHDLWTYDSVLQRVVEWAWFPPQNIARDREVMELTAEFLSWTLLSSNRYLRDRSTKALVSLCTEDLSIGRHLLDIHAQCDDSYILERLFAALYGASMRVSDIGSLSVLADIVFERVFLQEQVYPHILLRDYARGICERAHMFGWKRHQDLTCIKPPYKSEWPLIPTEEEINSLKSAEDRGSYDSRDPGWSRGRIFWSVFDDDFSHYVIGTNSRSNGWQNILLTEPEWLSPEEALNKFGESMSPTEWEAVEKFTARLSKNDFTELIDLDTSQANDSKSKSSEAKNPIRLPKRKIDHAELIRSSLSDVFSDTKLEEFTRLWNSFHSAGHKSAPDFDLSIVQRYIAKRVFDLGWSTELFGEFDRDKIGYEGRSANKPERFGKKYQWIAYHEVLAHISDFYRFKGNWWTNEPIEYRGPWQLSLRDIDPSCLIRDKTGGTGWQGHSSSWWSPISADSLGSTHPDSDWVRDISTFPNLKDLLESHDTDSGSDWIIGNGFFSWKFKNAGFTQTKRDCWALVFGYLVKTDEVEAFREWASKTDFSGRWMPEASSDYTTFQGEYYWSPAFLDKIGNIDAEEDQIQPENDCPVNLRVINYEYLREKPTFDCSIDDSYTFSLPDRMMVDALECSWSGDGSAFEDGTGQVVVCDPSIKNDGASCIIFRKDELLKGLVKCDRSLVWVVLGEKNLVNEISSRRSHGSLRVSGYYVLSRDGLISGEVQSHFEEYGS